MLPRLMTGVMFAVLLLAAPTVKIEAPASGWTTERVITVTGRATDAAELGVLTVNGVERPLPLAGGQFTATFALGRGHNAIEVIAPAKDAKAAPARDRVTLYAEIPRVDLQVLLFWDTDQTDVDLHVTEPSGEEVNYTNRVSTKTGGTLDRDDTDGYGPEIFSLGAAPSGVYEIAAHYYGDRGSGQTSATVMIVAREGTDEERRWRFEVPLTRAGEKALLAKIDLPPPGMSFDRDPKEKGAPSHVKDSALPHGN
jgi:uncharacterized protein YfaP (DUF2135 family)